MTDASQPSGLATALLPSRNQAQQALISAGMTFAFAAVTFATVLALDWMATAAQRRKVEASAPTSVPEDH